MLPPGRTETARSGATGGRTESAGRDHQHGQLADDALPARIAGLIADPIHPRGAEGLVGQGVRAGDGDQAEWRLRLLDRLQDNPVAVRVDAGQRHRDAGRRRPANTRAIVGVGGFGCGVPAVSAAMTVMVTVLTAWTGCSGVLEPATAV